MAARGRVGLQYGMDYWCFFFSLGLHTGTCKLMPSGPADLLELNVLRLQLVNFMLADREEVLLRYLQHDIPYFCSTETLKVLCIDVSCWS